MYPGVLSGGTISAEYTIFEYIETSGVTVVTGAIIDPVHPFNHCTFKKGPTGCTLLTILNSQILTIDGANFPLTTYSPTYGVAKTLNSGHITFINVEGAFVGTGYENDPYGLIDWPSVIPGIWIGEHSSIWAVGNNWKNYLQPGPNDDAIIAAGTPHDPAVTYGDHECKNLIIEAGASLEILDHALTVYDDVIIHGELIMNQNASVLNAGDSFGDIISWESGSSANVSRGNINVFGDWYFKDGTNAQLGAISTVLFYGSNNSTIYGEDGDAGFGNLTINKSNSLKETLTLPAFNQLRVAEDLYIGDGTLKLNEGSLLEVGNEFYVDNGCTISATGTVANQAIISGDMNFCMFEIGNGGTISAEYTLFQYMQYYGLVINPGGLIDPLHPLTNCTFQHGPVGGSLLTIENDQFLTIEGAVFPTNTWAGGSNVRKTVDEGQVNFIDFTGDFSGDLFENDPHHRIDWTHPWYNLNIKVFLEGPFGTSMMTTDLNSIPLSQPFNTSPWNYEGLEVLGEVPLKMVDWVLVELRDAPNASSATSGTVIARKAALLTNNGHVRNRGDYRYTV